MALRSSSPGDAPAPREQRILVLAPTGNDAQLTAAVLGHAGLETQICRDMSEIFRELADPCGTMLLAEETLNFDSAAHLLSHLADQPPWSDLPVIIITSGSEADQSRLRRLAVFGPGSNVSLLERPFRPETLTSAIEAALRARRRQYQLRDLFQKLQASDAQVTAIIDLSPVSICLADHQLRIRQVNKKARPLFAAVDDLIGRDVSAVAAQLWSPATAADLTARFRRVLETGESYFQPSFSDERLPEPSRKYYDVEIHRIAAMDGRYAVACYFADITAHLAAQKDIRDTVERLHLAAEAMNGAREAAERANRAKDDFLAALSHELRTPLSPVLLLATEAATDPKVPADLRSDFDTIAKNVQLEARLIDDLLDLTRITRGKLRLERRPTSLHGVLRDAIANVEVEVRQKPLILAIELEEAVPIVDGDPVRLQQVFWNVLKNAAKFTPAGGRISVRTRTNSKADRATIEITDTGIGLAPNERDRIFDAFAQGDHASRGGSHRFGGLGLGLAISRTLVELHSGTIRATSEGIGRGSCFTIELPLIGTGSTLEAETTAVGAPAPAAAAPESPLRILLVEDHEPTRKALARLLGLRSHEVAAAGTLAEAWSLGTQEPFDLLITDLGLPDGSGDELMEELGKLRGLKGIALSGYGMEQDLERSHKAGFVAHLTKPVPIRTLDEALALVMESARR